MDKHFSTLLESVKKVPTPSFCFVKQPIKIVTYLNTFYSVIKFNKCPHPKIFRSISLQTVASHVRKIFDEDIESDMHLRNKQNLIIYFGERSKGESNESVVSKSS